MSPNEMRTLWTLLGQTWGNRFLEEYGPRPNEAWSAALNTVDFQACTQAMRALIDLGSPFPPTLPEFLKQARRFRARPTNVVELPPPPMAPEKIRSNLERLRALIAGK